MSAPLAEGARGRLLVHARAVIRAHLAGEHAPLPEVEDEQLLEPRGAFVTLRRGDGGLRGCIGRVETDRSILETVAEVAVAAATTDPRFRPVTVEELPELRLEISALSPPAPVHPDRVEVGLHGLIVRHGGRSGLLLPQVATEYGWDRESFLDWVCRKAGLPRSTWREEGCELLCFTAEVFSEE